MCGGVSAGGERTEPDGVVGKGFVKVGDKFSGTGKGNGNVLDDVLGGETTLVESVILRMVRIFFQVVKGRIRLPLL